MPWDRMISRYSGMVKFEVSVRRWGVMPGKAWLKPVASVAKVAMAPLGKEGPT
jgi:hypothetical protein